MRDLRIALTFDAEHPSRSGNAAGTDEAILTALAEADVRATFFLQGRWASAYPAVAHRIAAEGHQVGNHSLYHAPMPLLSDAGIRIDVLESERRIEDAAGVDPKPWFRCPFGDGADQAPVLSTLSELGYRHVDWNVDSQDWSEDRSPADVRSAVVDGATLEEAPAVVLFHTWSAATAAALAGLLADLRARAASFVTVAEAIDGG
jgi:peptidoglycan/xylan/chitin deacetylase (PgdA/CDA1 family)